MLRLYNTATRRGEEFVPLRKGRVGMYSCGPTVYHYAHLGNLRSFLFSDVLRRTLELIGYRVTQVMNITDVGHLVSNADEGEDKMVQGARREGKTAWDVANVYTKSFLNDLAALNIETPTKLPRATDYIKQQIALVVLLQKRGYTYRIEDGIYFDTTAFPAYASFAHLKLDDQRAGARVDVTGKKNPTDFALWKFSHPGGRSFVPVQDDSARRRDMEWDSPWGTGFPGWHLECSAMSRELLGQPFDIHTGGADHIPVHHTNEIAQSVAAYGRPLARYWMHNGFLVLPGGQKVSKSADNFETLGDIIRRGVDPLAYRLFVFGTHYRKPLTWSEEALQSAGNALDDLRDRLRDWPKPPPPPGTPGGGKKKVFFSASGRKGEVKKGNVRDRFVSALSDDLNTPRALAAFFELAGRSRPAVQDSATIAWMDRALGLRLTDVLGRPLAVPSDVRKLIAAREAARAVKDFKKADAVRRKIEAVGFRVEDTPHGPRIIPNRAT